MKKILTITALALLALSAAGQDIISESQSIVAMNISYLTITIDEK